MARKLRVVHPGAICRVMNRGDRREPIFRSDRDRVPVPDPLTAARQKTGWQVRDLCLGLNRPGGLRSRGGPNHCGETTMKLQWIAQGLNPGTGGSLVNFAAQHRKETMICA